jgi:hypothetical protein
METITFCSNLRVSFEKTKVCSTEPFICHVLLTAYFKQSIVTPVCWKVAGSTPDGVFEIVLLNSDSYKNECQGFFIGVKPAGM